MRGSREHTVRLVTTASLFGVVHAFVDTASVAILYNEVAVRRLSDGDLFRLFLLYNCVAFGLQLPLGWLSDRYRMYRPAAVVGLLCTAGAILAHSTQPHLAAVWVGVGNALFHVGAGAMVLQKSGGRATPAGIFVAPGAFGVWLGVHLGLRGFDHQGLCTIGLLVAAMIVALRRPAATTIVLGGAAETTIARPGAAPRRLVLLLLVSVALRSLLGGCISGAWSGTSTALWIVLAAVCGKTAGGLIADGVGWRATAVTALVLVAPLVVPAAEHRLPAIASSLLVQVTMAVTLVAVYLAMPARPGMAFGLPSLSILLGALPDLTGHVPVEIRPWLPIIALLSAALLFGGLTPGARKAGGVLRDIPTTERSTDRAAIRAGD
jgi:FSR family fosmidomycin resistance protein-like MFS transporter